MTRRRHRARPGPSLKGRVPCLKGCRKRTSLHREIDHKRLKRQSKQNEKSFGADLKDVLQCRFPARESVCRPAPSDVVSREAGTGFRANRDKPGRLVVPTCTGGDSGLPPKKRQAAVAGRSPDARGAADGIMRRDTRGTSPGGPAARDGTGEAGFKTVPGAGRAVTPEAPGRTRTATRGHRHCPAPAGPVLAVPAPCPVVRGFRHEAFPAVRRAGSSQARP